MAQHFLLSTQARTLSLKEIYKAGEAAAYEPIKRIRWSETGGEAVCPRCGCAEAYDIATRRRFKRKACHHQFSVTGDDLREPQDGLHRSSGRDLPVCEWREGCKRPSNEPRPGLPTQYRLRDDAQAARSPRL